MQGVSSYFCHIVSGFTVVLWCRNCLVSFQSYKTSFGDGTIFIPYDLEYLKKKTVVASISHLPPQMCRIKLRMSKDCSLSILCCTCQSHWSITLVSPLVRFHFQEKRKQSMVHRTRFSAENKNICPIKAMLRRILFSYF